jgi:histidinol-phosphate aminotransferase
MISGPRPRPGILEIKPYVGGKAEVAGGSKAAKLSANETPLGASPKAVEAYLAAAGELHRYPEGGAIELRRAIGRRMNVDPDRIVIGAGSDELIALLIRAYAGPGEEVLYSRHGFLMYKLSALAAGAVPVAAPEKQLHADVDAILERVSSRTRMVFIANPNNPTGSYLPTDEILRLHRGLPDDVLLVLDSAYAEYVGEADYDSGLALSLSAPNVVMTRTFSKIHGLAALRVGWMTASPQIVDVINRVRGPFNVAAPAQAAATAAIDDVDHQAAAKAHNDRWLGWLCQQLETIGLTVHPSVGNFLLIGFPDIPGHDAAAAAEFLEKNGVIPRAMASYQLPLCLRLTVGTEEENRKVVDLLRTFMDGLPKP